LRTKIPVCLRPVSGLLFVLLLPCLVAAQQPDQAKKELTQRVDQLYHIFMTGEWKLAEPFLTEDSKSIWSQAKTPIDSFEIKDVTIAPDGKEADVTVSVTSKFPQMSDAPFTRVQKVQWINQEGQWLIQLQAPRTAIDLFKSGGTVPAAEGSGSPLGFTPDPVKLVPSGSGAKTVLDVAFKNRTPIAISIQNLRTTCACLQVEADKTDVAPGEGGTLTLTYLNSSTPPEHPPLIQATLAPAMYSLELPVEISK
jgi:uncharacterized protein DUF1573